MNNPLPRIQISENRRFLQMETGSPFFYLGDTAWELFHRLTTDEANRYLENRRQKGFNVIQAVVLAELKGLSDPTPDGLLPLEENDPTRPVMEYFDHVVNVLRLAAEKSLYVGLLPTWGDKVVAQWGGGPVIFTPENARIYGRYLGERCKGLANIIWVLGGDRTGEGTGEVWDAMAAGIAEGYGEKPITTYHPYGPTCSYDWFHHADWLDFNMTQSGHFKPDYPNWEMIAKGYALQPAKPILEAEANYEDLPYGFDVRNTYFNAYDVRKQSYRSVFAGGCGITYGHCAIWQMASPKHEALLNPRYTWEEALDRPGAFQMQYIKNLMLSRPYFERIPDQNLLGFREGNGQAHIQATRAADGSYAMVYMPQAEQMVAVDLSKLSGERIRAWWYDPRTGEAVMDGEFARGGTRVFLSPGEGPDWVLVLDDTSYGFGAPGVLQ